MPFPILPSNSATGYFLNKSLRFRSSATAYLNRTPASASNRQKFTISVWYKAGKIGVDPVNANILNAGGDGSSVLIAGTGAFGATYNNSLIFREAGTTLFYWPMVFRDPSAWYHIVFAMDTTQATASNRAKLYVNGVDQGAFLGTAITQNTSTSINNNSAHYINTFNGTFYPSDLYYAEYNFVDGQQLTASSFGSTNALTGVWQPAKYTGTYGTNGFYLPFNEANTASYAGSFSGSSQWISVPNLSAYNVGTSNYTVEGWYYFNNLSSTQGLFGCDNGSGSTPKFLGLVNTSGAILLEFTNSGGATFLTSSSGVVSAGEWTHIAWVRNSGTSTIYVNGIAVGSTATSVNLAGLTQAWNIGYIGEAGPSSLNGYASNFRLVTGTAVYTSNFVPSTQPLTAISGTQILTLQNATLVDNSSNAQTVTNTGGVTVATANPFLGSNIASDQSGNANNWNTNNISLTAGTTYDSMTDVPTLTSATTANYCVWNPLAVGTGITTSSGNLYASASNNSNAMLQATFGLPSGKWYWEVTLSSGTSAWAGSIIKSTAGLNYSSLSSGDAYSYSNDGSKYNGQSSTGYGNSYTTNDVIGVAYNATTGKIWYAKNGTWQASGDPAAGTNEAFSGISGTYLPSALLNSATGIANFGAGSGFTYTPPTGFVALNTYNLPTSTIVKGNTVMDATTWTGTGVAQNIVNSGSMKPDFVWIKARNQTYDNQVWDSVRGALLKLATNNTSAESSLANSVTGFNSNGIALGDTATVNLNTGTFVGWQWQAGQGTTSSNTSGSITSTVSANPTAGFSVVTYTGSGSNGTVGHGLGVAPKMIFVKDRTQGGTYRDWAVYNSDIGAGNSMYLNSTSGSFSKPSYWNSTAATSSVFSLGSDITVNQSGDAYVAYCWSEVAGFSKFGSYTGNASTDGPFIYCGFRPKFIMTKASSTGSIWGMWDSSRNTYNAAGNVLQAQASDAEISPYNIDILSNGFKMRDTNSNWNGSGQTFIVMAFAENPFKNALAR